MSEQSNFDHAVTLAAGFIANGDIRLAGSTRGDSDSLATLRDLLVSLSAVVADAHQQVRSDEEDRTEPDAA